MKPYRNNMALNLGFTLIEVMMVMAVAAILVSASVPSFVSTLEKYRTQGAAENLYATLIKTKSQTIKSGQDVHFTVQPGGNSTAWCYGVSSEVDCDCWNPVSCPGGGNLSITTNVDYQDVSISSDLDQGHLGFSPRNSLPSSSAVLTVSNASGKEIKLTVNPIGRIGLCSDDYPGYGACT